MKRIRGAVGLLALTASVLALSGLASAADPVVTADNTSGYGGSDVETVVVTGTKFNPDVAPAKASLATTQPETIITKSYIEDSVAATSDYVTLLAIVPSLTGLSINGPGLSDGNVKNTLRGMPDGNFGLAYDGIPFGDTNGPTHHSESYFPGSTIGSTVVDRGPGNAGTLGASTFGGTIKLFSENTTDDFHALQTASYGSWNTWNFNTRLQTGNFSVAGMNSRVLVNFQDTGSGGYLTLQDTHHDNELVKVETDIAPNWTLTLFANRNWLGQTVNDSNGATPAQITSYGKRFALQSTNPNLPTYAAYNPERKLTDMDYIRLRGDISDNIHLDDQAYTYAYINKTVTTTNITQTLANITGGTFQSPGTKVNGVSYPTDIPGYTKKNAYRVWGNIFRLAFDYDFGAISGEVRTGFWSEWAATQRERFYFDVTLCNQCDAFGVEKSGLYADQKTSSGTVFNGVPGVGYYEHTGWSQYEPFIEVDIKPTPDLTITPGLKYVWWEHTIDPNSLVKGKPPTIYGATVPANPSSFTTTRLLPFATVNYKLTQSWSVYAQYANGIYVPDITAFEVNTPILTFPKPQTTTNYQFGTVYYADNFSIDADAYYIVSDNTIQQDKCSNLIPPGPSSDTCNFNAGTVIYEGVEGETTYAFDNGLVAFANGSLNAARAHSNPYVSSSAVYQSQQAPFWTAAAGLIYKANRFKLSLIDKITGPQYQDKPSARAADGSFYKTPVYNVMDFTGSYDLGNFGDVNMEFGGGIYNILGSRNIVGMTINDKVLSGSSASDLVNRPNSLDQYYFQPERSIQITLKARL
jgi:iron complex outermembrane receptor protein